MRDHEQNGGFTLPEWVTVIVILMILWHLWPPPDHFVERSKVSAALAFIEEGQKALEFACRTGAIASRPTLGGLGLPESDPKAYVLHAELRWIASNTVRFKVAMTGSESGTFLNWWASRIRQGSFLECELVCLAEKTLSTRFVASTVEQKFLPRFLRDP